MNDKDLMPFGKHKGRRLQDVPAKYLDWLLGQDWVKPKYPELWIYLLENKETIYQELDYEDHSEDQESIY